MPMRRTLGVSLAFLVISASAMGKTPEKSICHHPGQPDGAKPQKAITNWQATSDFKREHVQAIACAICDPSRYAPRYRHAVSSPAADDSGGRPDPYLAPAREIAGREIGKAAWYNLVGGYTSTGERLDTVTATAAHRTLPLSSYARVTNLDTGRSVIVKINDRGPQTRRFIIDLSPRAADALDMKRAGVASVMVEPISTETRRS